VECLDPWKLDAVLYAYRIAFSVVESRRRILLRRTILLCMTIDIQVSYAKVYF